MAYRDTHTKIYTYTHIDRCKLLSLELHCYTTIFISNRKRPRVRKRKIHHSTQVPLCYVVRTGLNLDHTHAQQRSHQTMTQVHNLAGARTNSHSLPIFMHLYIHIFICIFFQEAFHWGSMWIITNPLPLVIIFPFFI